MNLRLKNLNFLPLACYLVFMLTPFNSIEPDGVLVELSIIDNNPSETFLQFKKRSDIEQLKTNSQRAMLKAIAKNKSKKNKTTNKSNKKSQFLTLLEVNKTMK